MKYEIMLAILFDLLSKRTVSAKYLAEKHEVCVRTIYRYISALEGAGVPLYSTRGVNGGFSIVDTYKLSSTFLTRSEYELAINTLSAIADNMPDKALVKIIDKLKANCRNENSGFSLKSGSLLIDASPWGDTNGYKSKIAIIQKSIELNKKLEINYHDRNGEITKRTIEPHIVVFKQGLWYVFAFCNLRNEFRLFKLGRIESANLTDQSFIRQDLDKLKLPLDFWVDNLNTENIILEVSKSVKSDVEEWLGIENIYEKNGKTYAEATLPYDSGLITKIMSFGKGIKVLSPTKLKDEIISSTKTLLSFYGE